MDTKTIQINNLKRKIGTLETIVGIKTINSAISDFTDTQRTFNQFSKGLAILEVPVSQLDTNYYFTSYDNWQKIIRDTIDPIIQSMDWTIDRRDCFMPNTPLICKINNEIVIKEVRELPEEPENTFVLDKDLQTNKIGWTQVNWVKSKNSDKNVIVVHNPDGFLELTDDHKVYIQKKWYKVGELEKHNEFRRVKFTTIKDWSIFKENKMDEELAFAYGVFLAEGTAGKYKTKNDYDFFSWHIDMGERDVLERVKIAFEKEFNRKFEIKLYPSQKKGSIRGGVKATKDMFRLMNTGTGSKEITEKFINMFYTEYKEKKVPLEILNADKKSQEQFLIGYIAGDGYLIKKKRKSWVASCKSRIALFGLQILSEKIGWAFSIFYDKRTYGKRKTCPCIAFYPDGIKKTNKFITEENKNEPRSLYFYKQFYRENRGEQEVYDINTASGHFFANNFLVHNCDKQAEFVIGLVAYMFELNTIRPFFCHVYRVSDGQWTYDHYATVFVDDAGNSYIYDYDNVSGGLITKITSKKPIMGNCKYIPIGVK